MDSPGFVMLDTLTMFPHSNPILQKCLMQFLYLFLASTFKGGVRRIILPVTDVKKQGVWMIPGFKIFQDKNPSPAGMSTHTDFSPSHSLQRQKVPLKIVTATLMYKDLFYYVVMKAPYLKA